ncbi:MAG: twitching motility protein PilT [Chloroflexi bacterium OLB15]|nr:MAG: twitching motility protein PilT [Chloroflexi bacterium OLB15]
MLTADFISRIVGMVVFAIIGARLGVEISDSLRLDDLVVSFFFGLIGILFGLILTPWLTVRPVRRLSRAINEQPIEVLFTTVVGLLLGLLLALLLAYPLSLLPQLLGDWFPAILSVVLAYVFTSLFRNRSREVWGL